MTKIKYYKLTINIFSFIFIFTSIKSCEAVSGNPISYKIGGVLSNNASQVHFKKTIDNLNFDLQYVNRGIVFYHTVIGMDSNPIRTALSVCKSLIAERVYAIVVSHPLTGDLSPAAVSYTSGFYHIPVIGISSRDSAFSDKNIHVSFLRTVPPYSHQADVWVELLKHFNYMKIIFIHSSDTDGRALLGRFQTTSQSLEDDVEIKVHVGCALLNFSKASCVDPCIIICVSSRSCICTLNIYQYFRIHF